MISIRPAHVEDVPVLLAMLRESAEAQGFPDEVVVTGKDLTEDGFGPAPRFRALVADIDGVPAGMALYFLTYSTWGSRLVLYLEDLCVRPQFRGRGIAREILNALARIAVDEGCGRMQWLVHKENAGAIRVYEAFGAAPADEWQLMSIRGEALLDAGGRQV
jgi:GNAT superfamily N-acetyltransferase